MSTGSSAAVTMITGRLGSVARIRLRTSTPPRGRILISSSTTSGRTRRIATRASAPCEERSTTWPNATRDALRISEDSTSSSTINTFAESAVTPPCEPNASTPSPRVLIFDEGTLTARTVGWKQRSSQSGHSRNAEGKNPCVRDVRGKARGKGGPLPRGWVQCFREERYGRVTGGPVPVARGVSGAAEVALCLEETGV